MVKTKNPADYPPLTKSVKQHVPDTLTDLVETIFSFAQGYQAETPETAPAKKYHRQYKNDDEYDDISRHNLPLLVSSPNSLLGAQFSNPIGKGWNYLKDITDNPIISHLKDRCLPITVDGDDYV